MNVDPQLSGWVTDSKIIGDHLFARFFLSDYYQSNRYHGQISSFAYVLKEGTEPGNDVASTLKRTLESYYSRYFTNVQVESVDITGDLTSKGEIALYLAYTGTDNKVYNLEKIIYIESSIAKRIINISNEGTE